MVIKGSDDDFMMDRVEFLLIIKEVLLLLVVVLFDEKFFGVCCVEVLVLVFIKVDYVFIFFGVFIIVFVYGFDGMFCYVY